MFVVGVAQSARASGCGPEGRGFESHHPPHEEIDLALGRGQEVRHGTLDPGSEVRTLPPQPGS